MGAGLVIIALVLAIANAALGPSSIPVLRSRPSGVGLAILISLVAYLLLLGIGRLVRTKHRESTAMIIVSLQLDQIVKKNPIPRNEIPSLRHGAHALLRLPEIQGECTEDLLRRIAQRVGYPFPEPIQFEEEARS